MNWSHSARPHDVKGLEFQHLADFAIAKIAEFCTQMWDPRKRAQFVTEFCTLARCRMTTIAVFLHYAKPRSRWIFRRFRAPERGKKEEF
jgi:hypothetical protein